MGFRIGFMGFVLLLWSMACTQKGPKVEAPAPVPEPRDFSYLKLQFDATSAIRQTTKRPKIKALHLVPLAKGSKEFTTAFEGVRQFILNDISYVGGGQKPLTKNIDVNKIYKVSDHCNGHPLYAFSDADLVPVKLVKRNEDDDEIYAGNFGSAGYTIRVFSVMNGKAKIYLDQVLTDVYGVTERKGCPRIVALMHGSTFGDSGYEYGVGVFEFKDRAYRLITDRYGDSEEVREYDLEESS